MYKFIIIVTLFINSIYANLIWNDISFDQKIFLNQEIFFEKEQIKLSKETVFILKDQFPLEQIKVEFFKFKLKKCSNPNIETEMILIDPKQKDDNSVGVQITKDCILEVFVEFKDLYDQSFFKDGVAE